MYGGLATATSSTRPGRQGVEPRSAGDAHVGGRGGRCPARLAPATSRASRLASVSHTVTPSSGSSSASASPMAPEPVPRSATVSGRAQCPRQLDRPRRRRPPSPAAGSAPGDRRRGRGGGSSSGRARRPAARRRSTGRASRRGGRPCAGVAGSSSTSSRPPARSAPLASSHSQRAAGSPTCVRRLGEYSSPPLSHRLGELARSLVGGEGGDDVVEVAGQHVGEAVHREPDAVIGEPVLLEVVRADLLASSATTDLGPARRRALGVAFGSASSSSRERSTVIALVRFCSWLRSSCIDTTNPVGRWVMRTAESVVLTLWPPGPLDRYTSICRSLSSIRTSISSASGRTSHGRRRGVDAPLALRDGDPLDAVAATFVLERRPGPPAGYGERHLVEAAAVAGIGAQRLGAQAVPLGVGEVHLVQVASEEVGLLAALGAADLDDDVAPGVRVGRDHQLSELAVDRGRALRWSRRALLRGDHVRRRSPR